MVWGVEKQETSGKQGLLTWFTYITLTNVETVDPTTRIPCHAHIHSYHLPCLFFGPLGLQHPRLSGAQDRIHRDKLVELFARNQEIARQSFVPIREEFAVLISYSVEPCHCFVCPQFGRRELVIRPIPKRHLPISLRVVTVSPGDQKLVDACYKSGVHAPAGSIR